MTTQWSFVSVVLTPLTLLSPLFHLLEHMIRWSNQPEAVCRILVKGINYKD